MPSGSDYTTHPAALLVGYQVHHSCPRSKLDAGLLGGVGEDLIEHYAPWSIEAVDPEIGTHLEADPLVTKPEGDGADRRCSRLDHAVDQTPPG
jgi:hypothetical protein